MRARVLTSCFLGVKIQAIPKPNARYCDDNLQVTVSKAMLVGLGMQHKALVLNGPAPDSNDLCLHEK